MVWLLPIVAVAGAVGLARARRQAPNGPPRQIPTQGEALNRWPTAEEWAAWWRSRAGGPPSPASSDGRGQVTPMVTQATSPPAWRGFMGASREPWSNQPAARGSQVAMPSSPGGKAARPGPAAPGMPTPQSAVESSSPWLPATMQLAAPLAANRWYFGLSAVDPAIAVAAGSGGIIDVKRVEWGTVVPSLRA